MQWFKATSVDNVPANGSVAIEYKGAQIALYNLKNKTQWFASQNLCPHKKQMILGRGIVGDHKGIPQITCPMHKKSFSLNDGCNLAEENLQITIYSAKVEDGFVYINLPEDEKSIPSFQETL